MRTFLRGVCAFIAMMALASCSSTEHNRPTVYRGGQYYGDAVHSTDLNQQNSRFN